VPRGAAVHAEVTAMRVDMVKGDDTEVVGSGVVMTCSGAEEAGGGTEKLGAGARDVRRVAWRWARQRIIQLWSLIPNCYELPCEGKVIG
jgi:hypothetical protein